MAISAVPQPLIQSNDLVNGAAYSTRIQQLTTVGGAINVNPTSGSWIKVSSPVANMTFTFIGVPSDGASVWYVEMKAIGTYTVSWTNVTSWDGGAANTGAPNVNARTGRYVLMFYSPDGTSIYGKVLYAQLNS